MRLVIRVVTRLSAWALALFGFGGCAERSANGSTTPRAFEVAATPSALPPSSASSVTLEAAPSPPPSAEPPAPVSSRDEMVEVPAGWFVMGCRSTASPSCAGDAQPRHAVWLSAYAIDKYEVSEYDFARCWDAGVCTFVNERCSIGRDPNKPAACIMRETASKYCKWVGKRLPTEAEWERAARGLDERRFPWGDEPPDGSRACWQTEGPCDIGSMPSGVSPVGAQDMAGNVAEWVSDQYSPHYYWNSPVMNPTGYQKTLTLPVCGTPACGVTRGGSWADPVEALATTTRAKMALPDPWLTAHVGIRCARSLDG